MAEQTNSYLVQEGLIHYPATDTYNIFYDGQFYTIEQVLEIIKNYKKAQSQAISARISATIMSHYCQQCYYKNNS